MRKKDKKKKFVRTAVARKIGALIVQAEAFSGEEGKIALIVGDSGHGKSCCLRQYSEANKNTIYVELDRTMRSSLILSEIAAKVGVERFGWASRIAHSVVRKLKARHVVVILDEASSLNVKQLDLLRQIITVKAACPLILSGNNDLLRTVMQMTAKKGDAALDQFRSRVFSILDLDGLAGDGDDGLYSAAEIRELYEYGGIRLAGSAVTILRRICMTPGSGRLRICSHVIAALQTSSFVQSNGSVDESIILAAIEQLNLPARAFLPVAMFDDQQGKRVAIKAG